MSRANNYRKMLSAAHIFLLFLFVTGISSFLFQPRFVRTSTSLYLASESDSQAQLGIVTVYKKDGCPYCKNATALLEDKYGLTITFVDINGDQKEEKLQQMRTFSGGRNTVPQIFFNSQHLGGNDDVQKLDQDGALKPLVEEVKSTAVSMMQDNWFHPWY